MPLTVKSAASPLQCCEVELPPIDVFNSAILNPLEIFTDLLKCTRTGSNAFLHNSCNNSISISVGVLSIFFRTAVWLLVNSSSEKWSESLSLNFHSFFGAGGPINDSSFI